jgi:hypothetical protein
MKGAKKSVSTEEGSTIFWLFSKKVKMIFYHQHKISDPKNTIMPYIFEILGLWPNYGHIGQWSFGVQNRSMDFFTINIQFLITIEYTIMPYIRIFGVWPVWGVGHRRR